MRWLTANWPWWIAFGWLIGYELYALWTQYQQKRGRRATSRPTLSQLATRQMRRFPPLKWIAVAVVGVLIVHFFFWT